jgi:hypothetical protein
VHGFVFLSDCVITVFVWVNDRWSFGTGLLGLASAVVPFATLPFELVLDRRGRLGRSWRLGAGGEPPRTLVERVQAWVLRHPWWALAILVAGVTAVFSLLLWMGPPIPKS